MNLLFLDTETTGNDVAQDRLCQVCYKNTEGIHVGYFKPPIPMSVKSMSITHITNKMLEDKESFQESQMKKDLEELFKESVFVAHNAKFDIAILEAEGMTIPKHICTLRVARALDSDDVIPEYNLQFLRYYLDLEVEGNAHDAEGDVLVLEAVFQRLFAKLREMVASDDEAIEKMIEISRTPSLFTKFNFGKHKDKKIADALISDRGYLEWLLKQKLEAGDNDEDWIYTLQTYLKK